MKAAGILFILICILLLLMDVLMFLIAILRNENSEFPNLLGKYRKGEEHDRIQIDENQEIPSREAISPVRDDSGFK